MEAVATSSGAEQIETFLHRGRRATQGEHERGNKIIGVTCLRSRSRQVEMKSRLDRLDIQRNRHLVTHENAACFQCGIPG